ncbi:MAG: MFS transporter [Proteobacteria bacterium]|nr:MFS transporter [Pseudomonadota bacterium]
MRKGTSPPKASSERGEAMRAAVASVWAVILTIAFVQLANGLQTSLLGVRAGIENFPPWTIGLVMASYYVGYSIAPLASRQIIGRAGHVNTMAVGTLFAAIVIVAHAYLVAPLAWAALRAVSGFALSSLYVGAESWIHDRVENANRGRVFSIYMVMQMVAMTAAQLLLSVGDPRAAVSFIFAGVLFAASFVPLLYARNFAPDRVPPAPFGVSKLFSVSPLGAIATVLAGVSWSIVFTFGPVYAQRSGLDLFQVSIFMALAMAGGAIVQFPMGWLSDAIGRRLIIALISAGGIAVSLVGIWADAHSVLVKYVASFFVGALIFPLYGISAAHTNDTVSPQNRVSAAAGLVLLFGFGSIFGPLASGGAISALGASGYFVVLAATMTVSLAAAAVAR